jgi:hypothetical protein
VGGISRDASDDDAMAERGDGLYRQGEKSKNLTSEANFDETVVITQTEDPVAVTANSGLDSGLDKREEAKPQIVQGFTGFIAESGRDSSAASPAVAVSILDTAPKPAASVSRGSRRP